MNRNAMLLLVIISFTDLRAYAQLPNYVPQNGLKSFWMFNGTNYDESGYNNTAKVHYAKLTTDRFGNDSCAYAFSRPNDYITTKPLKFDSAYSISMWVLTEPSIECGYSPSLNLGSVIISQGALPTPKCQGYSFVYGFKDNPRTYPPKIAELYHGRSITPSKTCYFNVLNYTNSRTSITSHFSEWLHICITKRFGSDSEKNIMKIYYNGLEVYSTKNVAKEIFIENGPMVIGGEIGRAVGKSFKGKIDDVGIWDRELTTKEVLQLFNTKLNP